MIQREEMDHFKLLEEKVGTLIEKLTLLRKENESLKGRIRKQEGDIADLTGELELLREARDKAKNSIVDILEKIEKLDI